MGDPGGRTHYICSNSSSLGSWCLRGVSVQLLQMRAALVKSVGVLGSKGFNSSQQGFAGVPLFPCSLWGEIPLREFLLAPICWGLENGVIQMKWFLRFSWDNPPFLSSTNIFFSCFFVVVQNFPWAIFISLKLFMYCFCCFSRGDKHWDLLNFHLANATFGYILYFFLLPTC